MRYFVGVFLWLLHLGLTPAGASAHSVLPSKGNPGAIGGILKGSDAWQSYRRRFVSDAGRVVDTGNNAMSHSEGQGYGLLLAVAAADRPTFDRILNWTILNLFIRYDNLPAWRWNWGLRTSHETNDAGDGDILIAWALAEAADFWNDPSYLSTARAITKDIVRNLIMPTSSGDIIMPGVVGFSPKEQPDGPVINLSYWVFPAFYRLAQVDPTYDWAALYQSGLELIRRAAFGPSRLPPDWLSVASE
jgi:endo-1,4-beta-D-glucanase Y